MADGFSFYVNDGEFDPNLADVSIDVTNDAPSGDVEGDLSRRCERSVALGRRSRFARAMSCRVAGRRREGG